MTEILQETSKSSPIMQRKVRTGMCNFVVVINNDSDDTLTATFLGAVLFKRLKVPVEASLVEQLIETLTDDEKRAKFCVKRGISEQMANEAVRDGAAKAFEEEMSTYAPDYSPKKHHKKAAVAKDADNDEDDKKHETSKKRTKKEEKFQSPDKKKAKKAVAAKPKKDNDAAAESEKKEEAKAEVDTPKQDEEKKD